MSNSAKLMTVLTVALAAVLCMSVPAAGGDRDVSQTVWYQGFLADVDTGEPVNGTVAVVASLYDQLAGGTMLWGEETHAGTVVTEGWFNIELGSSQPLLAFGDPPYYLELTVAGELLEPRVKLASVPMALRSAAADSGDGDWTVLNGNVYRETGRVGIGATIPSTALHVAEDDNMATTITIENEDTGANSAERITFKNENGGVAFISCYDEGNATYPSSMVIANNRPRGRIVFKPDAFSTVVIDSTGYVGIGDSSPASELTVGGTVETEGFKMTGAAADGHVLTSDAAGNGTWQAPDTGGSTLIDVYSTSTPDTIGATAGQYGDVEVSLTVPGAGYIICTSTVRVNINHANNSVSDYLQMNHSESPSALGNNTSIVAHHLLPADPIGGVYRSFCITTAHQVFTAGTYTYYLVGRMVSGQDSSDEFTNAQMIGVYYPN